LIVKSESEAVNGASTSTYEGVVPSPEVSLSMPTFSEMASAGFPSRSAAYVAVASVGFL
jgi:hypothetical protein